MPVAISEYTFIPDCGPDGEQVWLTVWLPRYRTRLSLRVLRSLAELYALGVELNAETQRRFGVDGVATRIESDDGNISITYAFDPDFSEAYDWRDKLITAAGRIITTHGGTVKA